MQLSRLKNGGFMQGDEKYRSILENMDLGLLEVDLEGVIQLANNSFCELSGYSKGDLIGQSAASLLVSKDGVSEKSVNSHSDKRLEGDHSVYEIQLTKKNGEKIWVLISGGPLYDDSGKVVGSIGIHHNFTEKKKAEEKQNDLIKEFAIINKQFFKKQEFLKAINDFSQLISDKESLEDLIAVITDNIVSRFNFEDCVIYILDQDTQLLNQVSAYGQKRDELGKVMNPIQIKIGEGIVGAVAETGKSEIILDTTRDKRYIVDDSFRHSEITVPIIYDDQILGIIDSEHSDKNFFTFDHLESLTTIANLIASKIKSTIAWEKHLTIEKELKESESKFRGIINSSLDAVIIIDSKGIITEWNNQSELTFGYKKKEAMGQLLSNLIIPKQHKSAHIKGMSHFHKTGEGPVLNKRIEITAIGKEREEFPIELSIIPIKVKGVYYFSAFLRDISEQKASQLKMEAALAKEKELNEMKSKFISMTSHELRTPLTTIRSNTELIEYQVDNSKDLDRAKLKKNVTRIDSNVDRLNQLINNILTIGKMDSNKVPFNPGKYDILNLIEKVVFPNLSVQDRPIILNKKGAFYMLNVDQSLFIHIISNLLENALKYSKNEQSPELSVYFEPEQVKIEIKDYGMGIPKDEQSNLFDTFFRASNVGNIQGSGLGLSIVNEFVKIHNGSININSEVNKGTIFTILLPK